MAEPRHELLRRSLQYRSQGLSLRGLEDTIQTERGKQDHRIGELGEMRQRNAQLQEALTQEMKRLKELSDYLAAGRLGRGFWANVREALARVPGLGGLGVSQRSIEQLLREQYETSSVRLKEATEFVDRLEAAESELYDEIERLNDRIVASAHDEELAADYVVEVKALMAELEESLISAEPGSMEARMLQAEVDHCRRVVAEHGTKLRLYHTAEERLDRLKDNTRRLAQTISNLRSDIGQYVFAASEKLDLAAGQIQAIGTAADASLVVLELKRSLDAMTESINHTTRFVAETQVYFREQLDGLVDDLEIYDDETRRTLDRNLAISEELGELRVAEAVTDALLRKEEIVLEGD